jgi:hypothetical protein
LRAFELPGAPCHVVLLLAKLDALEAKLPQRATTANRADRY